MVLLAVVSVLVDADSVLLLLQENKNIAKQRHKKVLFIINCFKLNIKLRRVVQQGSKIRGVECGR
jgi:hypothetical protein